MRHTQPRSDVLLSVRDVGDAPPLGKQKRLGGKLSSNVNGAHTGRCSVLRQRVTEEGWSSLPRIRELMQAEILIAASQRQNGQRRVLGTGRSFVKGEGDGRQRGLGLGTARRKTGKREPSGGARRPKCGRAWRGAAVWREVTLASGAIPMTPDGRCGGEIPTFVTFAIKEIHITDLLDVITIAKKA
ncbi:hypothetical protein E2C01_051153 [Portunus trituberculatus]|uniref:Uncharacterized protein n=1 Tax=Portunus trituberculatus TaxID=210409 RepID=A0A5B7GIT2_PORTR|nr:hypothetical protein [Portunus trituberculatus]